MKRFGALSILLCCIGSASADGRGQSQGKDAYAWEISLQGDSPRVVTSAGNRLLIDCGGRLYLVNAKTGTVVWQVEAYKRKYGETHNFSVSPAEALCWSGKSHQVVIIDLASGRARTIKTAVAEQVLGAEVVGNHFLVSFGDSAKQNRFDVFKLSKSATSWRPVTLRDFGPNRRFVRVVGSEPYAVGLTATSKPEHIELPDFLPEPKNDGTPANMIVERSRSLYEVGADQVLSVGSENWHESSGIAMEWLSKRMFVNLYKMHFVNGVPRPRSLQRYSGEASATPRIASAQVFSVGKNVYLGGRDEIYSVKNSEIAPLVRFKADKYLCSSLSLFGLQKDFSDPNRDLVFKLTGSVMKQVGSLKSDPSAIFDGKNGRSSFRYAIEFKRNELNNIIKCACEHF